MGYFVELKKYQNKTRKQVRKDVLNFTKNENINLSLSFPVLEYFEKIFEKDKNYLLFLTENDKNIIYNYSDISKKYYLYLSKNFYKYIEDDYYYRENITQFLASYYFLKDLHDLYIQQDEIDKDLNKLYWKLLDLYKEELLLPYDMIYIEADPLEVCERYKINMDMYVKLVKKKCYRNIKANKKEKEKK